MPKRITIKHACIHAAVTALSMCIVLICRGESIAYGVKSIKHLFDIQHDFLQPVDITIGSLNRVYVLDGVRHRVVVFNESGEFLFAFGEKGTGRGNFIYPIGITSDSRGQIIIADSGNRRVQIFSPEGAFLTMFSTNGHAPPLESDPVDVAVDEKRGHLYVVDNDNHRILVFRYDSYEFLAAWGSEGKGRHQFNYPFLITVGQDTSVFVVDVLNTRVQVWSPLGKPVSTIGTWGIDPGQLYRPKGVCTDSDNTIFVSDSYLGVIQAFNRYGHFRYVLGTESGEIMKWETPMGIAIDTNRRLYVVEMLPCRVRVYKILEAEQEVKE